MGSDPFLAPEPTPRLGPEHAHMDVFVGEWNSDGWTADSSPTGRVRVTHHHTYEWLPGRFFLVHRWDGRIGDAPNRGIEIIGHDPLNDTYASHFFDSGGWARHYQAKVRDNVWTFAGERERATFVFGDDGNDIIVRWEQTHDGSNWVPLCEVRATRSLR